MVGIEKRPDKGSHLGTIYYEIDMWRHCFGQLAQEDRIEGLDRNVFLEGFLLHYRGLLEFFSGKGHRQSDLSFAEPRVWAERGVDRTEAASFRKSMKELYRRHHRDISQYLHHCTVRRFAEQKHWDVGRMFTEMERIVVRFEQEFPRWQ